MAESSYSYPGGGFQLKTSGGGLTGGGGTDDLLSFYREMAERRAAEQREDRSRRMARDDYAFQQAKNAGQQAASPMAGRDQADDHLKTMQRRAELARLQAMSGPAPTKLITGPQIIPGEVLDPLQMNSFQREAFLPGSSSMTGGPTGQEQARSQSFGDEADLERAQRILALKSRAGGGLAGSDRADWPPSGRSGIGG